MTADLAPSTAAMPEPSYLRSVRAAYDAVAADYAEHFSTELEAKPLGRAMLAAFAELVQATGAGPVAQAHLLAHKPDTS
jgi:hypothetical protein